MNIDEKFSKNLFNFLIILTILLIVFLTISYIYIRYKRKEIRQNWTTERCKPHIIPFAHYIKGFKEGAFEGSKKHYKFCMGQIFRPIFDVFLAPLRSMMNMIQGILKQFSSGTSSIRKLFVKIKIICFVVINGILEQIKPVLLKIRIIFVRNMALIKKMLGASRIITYILVTVAYTAISLFRTIGKAIKTFIIVLMALGWLTLFFCCSPILAVLGGWAAGVGLSWVCFDEDTEVILSNGEKRTIPLIRIGDKVMYGGRVTGVFKFSSSGVQMYNYKNVIVSACHGVYDNGKWTHIENCKDAKKIDYNKKFIYCIATENNKMFINKTMFTDYYEVSNPDIVNNVRNKQIKILNGLKDNIYIEKRVNTDNYGFYYTTQIKMDKNEFKPLYKLRIGDKTNFGTITGIIKLELSPDNVLYQNRYYPDLIVSGTQLVRQNGEWVCVYECSDFFIYNKQKDNNYIYNLLTDKGIIINQHYLFTDYNELCSTMPETVDEIDGILLNYLNKSTSNSIPYKLLI